ncbi:MAG: hypothetical protein ABSB52_10335 [Acidimicrobiales bacterium]
MYKGRLVSFSALVVLGAVSLPSLAYNALGAAPAAAEHISIEQSAAGPAPGTIFVANAGAYSSQTEGTGKGSVTAYRPGSTGNARPELVITAGVDGPNSIAFDRSGNLWVANTNSDAVTEYSRAELAEASPLPTVTISLNSPVGDAFSPAGDLWVGSTVGSNYTVDEFTKVQLAKSGSPKPVVSLSPSDCSFAFDASGNLWQGSSGSSVYEWAKSQLTRSGSPVPLVTISSTSLSEPCRPTFDSSGDMWAANYYGDSVVEFSKAQLTSSGSRRARITIKPKPSSSEPEGLNNPGDVVFDPSGDLWVPNAGADAVVELTKAQLAESGSPTPARIIAGPATGLNWPWSLAIEP